MSDSNAAGHSSISSWIDMCGKRTPLKALGVGLVFTTSLIAGLICVSVGKLPTSQTVKAPSPHFRETVETILCHTNVTYSVTEIDMTECEQIDGNTTDSPLCSDVTTPNGVLNESLRNTVENCTIPGTCVNLTQIDCHPCNKICYGHCNPYVDGIYQACFWQMDLYCGSGRISYFQYQSSLSYDALNQIFACGQVPENLLATCRNYCPDFFCLDYNIACDCTPLCLEMAPDRLCNFTTILMVRLTRSVGYTVNGTDYTTSSSDIVCPMDDSGCVANFYNYTVNQTIYYEAANASANTQSNLIDVTVVDQSGLGYLIAAIFLLTVACVIMTGFVVFMDRYLRKIDV